MLYIQICLGLYTLVWKPEVHTGCLPRSLSITPIPDLFWDHACSRPGTHKSFSLAGNGLQGCTCLCSAPTSHLALSLQTLCHLWLLCVQKVLWARSHLPSLSDSLVNMYLDVNSMHTSLSMVCFYAVCKLKKKKYYQTRCVSTCL